MTPCAVAGRCAILLSQRCQGQHGKRFCRLIIATPGASCLASGVVTPVMQIRDLINVAVLLAGVLVYYFTAQTSVSERITTLQADLGSEIKVLQGRVKNLETQVKEIKEQGR